MPSTVRCIQFLEMLNKIKTEKGILNWRNCVSRRLLWNALLRKRYWSRDPWEWRVREVWLLEEEHLNRKPSSATLLRWPCFECKCLRRASSLVWPEGNRQGADPVGLRGHGKKFRIYSEWEGKPEEVLSRGEIEDVKRPYSGCSALCGEETVGKKWWEQISSQ